MGTLPSPSLLRVHRESGRGFRGKEKKTSLKGRSRSGGKEGGEYSQWKIKRTARVFQLGGEKKTQRRIEVSKKRGEYEKGSGGRRSL